MVPCKIFWSLSPSLSLLLPRRFLYKKASSPSSLRRAIMAYQVAMQEENLRKGPWFEEEDERLIAIVSLLGGRRWDALAKASGLRRSGKSCRLRWMNYLRPNLKRGQISAEEERIILQLHERWGNKWSKIARRLPGRTDNEIKNYWRSHFRKKAEVREQENFGSAISNAEENLLIPKCDTLTLRTGNGDGTSEKDDISGTSVDSCDAPDQLENFSFANSPYEARLSDWISCWSYDQQSEMKNHGDCHHSSDLCFCQPAWISDDSDTSIWDSLDSIWDMD